MNTQPHFFNNIHHVDSFDHKFNSYVFYANKQTFRMEQQSHIRLVVKADHLYHAC